MQRTIVTANLIIAFVATTAPMAHVLEMISKLSLDGPLWLAIQQHLYRGWGPVFGPVEIAALLSSLYLVWAVDNDPALHQAAIVASVCYAGMLACFFVFNGPVNAALNQWTAAALPSDWAAYRLRWEIGHALAAVLSLVALVALVRARLAVAR